MQRGTGGQRKKIVFLGIILIIIPNNNFGQSSGPNEAYANFSLLIMAWSGACGLHWGVAGRVGENQECRLGSFSKG